MRFRARAKTPGECCYGLCMNSANKIYEGSGFKYLACSKAHAKLVEDIFKNNVEKVKKIWPNACIR